MTKGYKNSLIVVKALVVEGNGTTLMTKGNTIL